MCYCFVLTDQRERHPKTLGDGVEFAVLELPPQVARNRMERMAIDRHKEQTLLFCPAQKV
jgi:hypothetical protein